MYKLPAKGYALFLFLLIGIPFSKSFSQTNNFRVVGYYCGRTIPVDSFEIEKLTHLIFCFGGLQGNRFHIYNAIDSNTINRMVEMKVRNPKLKVMLSLGGWGGCVNCSPVFNTVIGRSEFVKSISEITQYFHTDGLDLDWEYPAIAGFPGHIFQAADKHNFTLLIKELRETMGPAYELSFAAGGSTSYIDSSIEWKEISPYVSFINIMSYDLVHGFSKTSGHHTPLYSTPQQIESTNHAVQLLLDKGVPADKLVIGAAFYGRFFRIKNPFPTQLYQPAVFDHGFSSKFADDSLSVKNGFEIFWDSTAMAPYAINASRKLLATYDNAESIALKTKYASDHHLGGIMFWQLYDDKFHHGLLDTIYKNK